MSVTPKKIVRSVFALFEGLLTVVCCITLLSLCGVVLAFDGPWTLLLALYSWSKQEVFTFKQMFQYHATSINLYGSPEGYYPWFEFLPKQSTEEWAQIHEVA